MQVSNRWNYFSVAPKEVIQPDVIWRETFHGVTSRGTELYQ